MPTSSGCSDYDGCKGGSEEKSLKSCKSIFGDGRDKEAQDFSFRRPRFVSTVKPEVND